MPEATGSAVRLDPKLAPHPGGAAGPHPLLRGVAVLRGLYVLEPDDDSSPRLPPTSTIAVHDRSGIVR